MSEDKASAPETETNAAAPAEASSEAPGNGGGTAEQRIAALEAERNEARDRMLRIAAEFENYKKRVRREQSEGESKARESVLRDVLEVADNLQRAAEFDEKADFKSLQKGLELVNRLFQGKLERYEVRPFESKGQPFDPHVHDAVSQLPSPDAAPGTVIGEVQKGYKIGDRLLRPALVVVAVAPPNGGGSGGSNP
jgi:molecular chaperone GrpE